MSSTEPDLETLNALGKALACWGRKFRVVCGTCYFEARCDQRRGEYLDTEGHQHAALHFWRQGWRLDKVPICPTCKKAQNADAT